MPTTWAGVIRPPVADRANRPLRGRGSPAGRCAPLAHVLPHQGNLRAHKFALHAQAPRLNPNGQQPVGDPIVPRPWGLPHRGPRVVAELAMLKAPFGRFSRLSSLHLCVLAKSAKVHFRQRRKFTALPCSSYPQRATARRGPHKPALLGFGLFCHVQIYCQAGVFPKRGYATSSRTRATSGLTSSPFTPRRACPSPQRAVARWGPHRLPSPGVTS